MLALLVWTGLYHTLQMDPRIRSDEQQSEPKFGSGLSWPTRRLLSVLGRRLPVNALFALEDFDQRLNARPVFEAVGRAIACVVGQCRQKSDGVGMKRFAPLV